MADYGRDSVLSSNLHSILSPEIVSPVNEALATMNNTVYHSILCRNQSLSLKVSGLVATTVLQCASWMDATALVILSIESNLRVNCNSAYDSIATECQLMSYQARVRYSGVFLLRPSSTLSGIKATLKHPQLPSSSAQPTYQLAFTETHCDGQNHQHIFDWRYR